MRNVKDLIVITHVARSQEGEYMGLSCASRSCRMYKHARGLSSLDKDLGTGHTNVQPFWFGGRLSKGFGQGSWIEMMENKEVVGELKRESITWCERRQFNCRTAAVSCRVSCSRSR